MQKKAGAQRLELQTQSLPGGGAMAATRSQGLRALVVEDDDEYLRLTLRFAVSLGWRTEAVTLGTRALAAMADVWQVVVVDLVLPDISGIHVVRAACESDSLPTIIAVSALASREEVFASSVAGADAFLQKPFTAQQLEEAALRGPMGRTSLSISARKAVGQLSLAEARKTVANAMLRHAVAMADGNLTEAAETLGIRRQVVQRMRRQDRLVPR